MLRRPSRSIQTRLAVLLFWSMLVPLACVLGLVAVRDVGAFKDGLTTRGILAAQLIGEHSAAELAFEDTEASRRTLRTAARLEELEFAAVYDQDGRRFASHSRGATPPDVLRAPAPSAAREISDGSVDILEPVTFGGVRYGTVHLRLSTAGVQALERRYLWGLAALGLVLVVVAALLAARLQRPITRPILELATVARRNTERGEASVRARKTGEDELGVLADSFNAMLDELERRQRAALEAVRVRDDFLSVASHELRTPLTVLQMHVHTLSRLAAGGPVDGARLQKHLATLRGQVQRLGALVGALLDVTRIAQGRVLLEPTDMDLAELAREVVERFGEEAARAQCAIELHVGGPVEGRWDAMRLDQVLTNLVSNAVKYGAGRPIEVTVDDEGDTARLVVRDHGIGIAPDDLERIFGRFERAVSPRHYSGLGLGLYITRQIVDAHGGRIRAESRPNDGTTFTLELPRRAPAGPEPEPVRPRPPGSHAPPPPA